MKKLLLSIFALLCIISCENSDLALENVVADNDLFASIESVNATKTSMDQNNNVLWSEGDQLVAFMKTTLVSRYQIKEQYVGTTTGGFSKVPESGSGDDLESGQEIDHNVVLYPYSSDVWCMRNDNYSPTQSYILNVVLPQTQIYAKNTFANGSFPMVAVSSNNQLTFKNVCGGIKLQFKGVDKIKSIKLEGLGGEAISGKSTVVCYVNGAAPAITMNAQQATKSITLDCGDGVQLNMEIPTTFIISVPPVEFKSGLKITVTDTDGLSRTLTNSSENTILRSVLSSFPVITYKQEGVFKLPEGTLTSYEIVSEGGEVDIPLTTNQDYKVIIPEGAGEWITVVETKALREETITLNIAKNTTAEARSAEVLIATTEGVTLQEITVSQAAGEVPSASGPADAEIWYTTSDGEILDKLVVEESTIGSEVLMENYYNDKGVLRLSGPVTTISSSCFYECTTLTSIVLPEKVTTIDHDAFNLCYNMSSILLPANLSKIGDYAFYFCRSLESIEIPANVTYIGDHAFSKCSSLRELYIKANIPPKWSTVMNSDPFEECNSDFKIYVPENLVSTYKAADGWSTYAERIEADPS